MEILSKRYIKSARKDHQCDWCNKTIFKGHPYEVSNCVGDCFYTWKSHVKCDDFVRKHAYNHFNGDDGDGYPPLYDWYINEMPAEMAAEYRVIMELKEKAA